MKRLLVVGLAALGIMSPASAQVAGDTFSDCEGCPEMTLLIDGSAIGTYLITRAEFAAFAAEAEIPGTDKCFIKLDQQWKNTEGKGWADPGFAQGDDHPAVCVNWLEATGYADWLSERSGQPYRLPTFEESVAVSNAGGLGKFWWGDDFGEICERANAGDANYRAAFPDDPRDILECDDGYAYTSPVTAFPPNSLGLYDVVGNVYQWTNSCNKGDCSNAIFRGGSWTVPNPYHFSHEGHWADRIILRNSAVGFRVMRDRQ